MISARDMSRKARTRYEPKAKPIPVFKSEAEERAFWERHDSTDYVDWKIRPSRFGSAIWNRPRDRLAVIPANAPATDGPLSPTLSHQGRGGRRGGARRLHRPCPSGSSTFSFPSPLRGRIRVCSGLDPGRRSPAAVHQPGSSDLSPLHFGLPCAAFVLCGGQAAHQPQPNPSQQDGNQ